MMKSPLFWKVSTLLGCILLLLIPLFMVSNLVSERESYRNDVENTLRQSTSGPQKLVGPLTVSYTHLTLPTTPYV